MKLRRKRRPGNRAMTVAEKARVDGVKRAGCLCCLAMGFIHDEDGPVVEAHHLLSGGIRRGHLFTVGLCMWHHRARIFVTGWDHAAHRKNLGPTLEQEANAFHALFGSDDALLDSQNRLLLGNGVAA